MPEEIINHPYQLTLEEKDQLLLSLLDHLDLEAFRTDTGSIEIRANGDAA